MCGLQSIDQFIWFFTEKPGIGKRLVPPLSFWTIRPIQLFWNDLDSGMRDAKVLSGILRFALGSSSQNMIQQSLRAS